MRGFRGRFQPPFTQGGPTMSAAIVARSETSFTVQVEIPYGSSMLDFEQAIQDRLNQAGVVATEEALRQFDTDGSPIVIGSVKFTSKGPLPKEYQTPYGVATVPRHVYQSPQGGKTYCPLDRDARIVTSSTPRFAKMIAHKYAEFGSGRVLIDLGAIRTSRSLRAGFLFTYTLGENRRFPTHSSQGERPCPGANPANGESRRRPHSHREIVSRRSGLRSRTSSSRSKPNAATGA